MKEKHGIMRKILRVLRSNIGIIFYISAIITLLWGMPELGENHFYAALLAAILIVMGIILEIMIDPLPENEEALEEQ